MKKTLKSIISALVNTEPVFNEIKRHVIKKYKKLNQGASNSKTPWVCEFPFNVNRWIEYINEVYTDYFTKSNLDQKSIIGKKILEIGPGENLGVALKFLANGASQVVCVDKFNSLIEKERQVFIYNKLYEKMNQCEKDRLKGVLKLDGNNFSINEKKLQYLNISIDDLKSFYSDSYFDMVISRAVLEHIYDVNSALDKMDHLLCKNGYMLHEVDFRDHGMFTDYMLHPLTFLSIDNKTWFDMTNNLGAPNRKLMNYYKSSFESRGYSCDTLFVRLFSSENKKVQIKNVPINDMKKMQVGKFHKLLSNNSSLIQPEDLVVASAFYCAQKQC